MTVLLQPVSAAAFATAESRTSQLYVIESVSHAVTVTAAAVAVDISSVAAATARAAVAAAVVVHVASSGH